MIPTPHAMVCRTFLTQGTEYLARLTTTEQALSPRAHSVPAVTTTEQALSPRAHSVPAVTTTEQALSPRAHSVPAAPPPADEL